MSAHRTMYCISLCRCQAQNEVESKSIATSPESLMPEGMVHAGGFGCLEEGNVCIKVITQNKDRATQTTVMEELHRGLGKQI